MIKSIEIIGIDYHVLINNDIGKCYINDKCCLISAEDIDNVIRIIREWNFQYCDNKIIGDNDYSIVVVDGEKEYVYRFHNKFPNNFLMLLDYIGGIYDR